MFFEDVTPIQRYHQILCHANPELATRAIEAILMKLAACEVALERKDIDENYVYSLLTDEQVIKLADSIAIDSMATIVSHNE